MDLHKIGLIKTFKNHAKQDNSWKKHTKLLLHFL
jgi:hypothetical protein